MVNRITKINYSNKKITIYISQNKYEIHPSSYLESYFYVGKILSKKEHDELETYSNMYPLYSKADTLLKNRNYTVNKLKDKLLKINSNHSLVDTVISSYINKGLINNSSFLLDSINAYNKKNLGELYIKKKLFERGFTNEEINNLFFDDKNEEKKCMAQLSKIKMNNPKLKKDKIIYKLMSKGFTSQVIQNVVKY